MTLDNHTIADVVAAGDPFIPQRLGAHLGVKPAPPGMPPNTALASGLLTSQPPFFITIDAKRVR